jgi:hypothetical protein
VACEDSGGQLRCRVGFWSWFGWACRMGWFVPVGHRCLCSACEPVGQHGGGGFPRGPWIVALEHERQTSGFPCPPRDGHLVIVWWVEERGSGMELVHPRCAGLDVSKRDAKVCVRLAGSGRAAARSTVSTWGAVTNQVLALREHLLAQQVTLVVMEATGDYWKPFYYLLEDAPFEVMLVNARHVKNLPGRKSDVSDAAWLAQLGAHGLVRGSFVPPEPIRQLRDLTRTRTAIVRERAREIQRLEKLLEDAGIKLSSVALTSAACPGGPCSPR